MLSDKKGLFKFINLLPGEYKVEVDDKSVPLLGMKLSAPLQNQQEITLDQATIEDLSVDFGYYGNASIGNYVWKDLNGNKNQDENEPPISNVTLALHEDTNKNGEIDSNEPVIQNTTTDINGFYNFYDLQPKSYINFPIFVRVFV